MRPSFTPARAGPGQIQTEITIAKGAEAAHQARDRADVVFGQHLDAGGVTVVAEGYARGRKQRRALPGVYATQRLGLDADGARGMCDARASEAEANPRWAGRAAVTPRECWPQVSPASRRAEHAQLAGRAQAGRTPMSSNCAAHGQVDSVVVSARRELETDVSCRVGSGPAGWRARAHSRARGLGSTMCWCPSRVPWLPPAATQPAPQW